MKLTPLHQIIKPNYLVVQFPSCPNVLMMESYCADPDCACHEALISFARINQEHKIEENLVDVKINLLTGKVFDVKEISTSIDLTALVQEFLQHFSQFQKHFLTNEDKVKVLCGKYYKSNLPEDVLELVRGNNCVSYQTLFPFSNELSFQFAEENYLIEDQYCMNPTCTCDEVIIVLYKENSLTSDLVGRLNLITNEYELLKNNHPNYLDIMNKIITEEKVKFTLRYNRMKRVGERFIK